MSTLISRDDPFTTRHERCSFTKRQSLTPWKVVAAKLTASVRRTLIDRGILTAEEAETIVVDDEWVARVAASGLRKVRACMSEWIDNKK